MNKTIFEKIIDREIPANIVYEDDHVIAFMDAFPIVKGHTLVVPKQPIENIYDLDAETGAKVMSVITKVSNAVKDAFEPAGLNVVQNNGAYASQSVFHLHFHIIPRYKENTMASAINGSAWKMIATQRRFVRMLKRQLKIN